MKILRKVKNLSPGDNIVLGDGLFTVTDVDKGDKCFLSVSKRKGLIPITYVVLPDDLIETIPYKKL